MYPDFKPDHSATSPDPTTTPPTWRSVDDIYPRGDDIFVSAAFATETDKISYLRDEVSDTVLVPTQEWELIKRRLCETPAGTPVADTYLRGREVLDAARLSSGRRPSHILLKDLQEQMTDVVLIPLKDWSMILSNTASLGARLHAAESQLNDLALYIRGRFNAQIINGEHEGLTLPEVIKRYLGRVQA